MCKECGCGKPGKISIRHPHVHDHAHDHEHPHEHAEEASRVIRLEQKVLAHNDEIAGGNRAELTRRGVRTLNLISSPGSGKTALLERTLDTLKGEYPCAVITGDQQTDNDAKRLAGRGAAVLQITTGNTCHLDAASIAAGLPKVLTSETRFLFIENVGNLICPAAFDLGEDLKVALLSVTEGEDKPLKYPALFSLAEVILVTKIDLAPHVDWNRAQCLTNLHEVSPKAKIIELSAKTGAGFEQWIEYLRNR